MDSKYPIPKTVVDRMCKQVEQLDKDFQMVWGLLPKCSERDEIMLDILNAKNKLRKYIEGVEVTNG